jgi:hypothetical protein
MLIRFVDFSGLDVVMDVGDDWSVSEAKQTLAMTRNYSTNDTVFCHNGRELPDQRRLKASDFAEDNMIVVFNKQIFPGKSYPRVERAFRSYRSRFVEFSALFPNEDIEDHHNLMSRVRVLRAPSLHEILEAAARGEAVDLGLPGFSWEHGWGGLGRRMDGEDIVDYYGRFLHELEGENEGDNLRYVGRRFHDESDDPSSDSEGDPAPPHFLPFRARHGRHEFLHMNEVDRARDGLDHLFPARPPAPDPLADLLGWSMVAQFMRSEQLEEIGRQRPSLHDVRLLDDRADRLHRILEHRLANVDRPADPVTVGLAREFANPDVVELSEDERVVVERLMGQGFDRVTVLQVFEACERNEGATVRCLRSMT